MSNDVVRVDLGSGRQAGETPGYIHIDIIPNEQNDYTWDLNNGLPKRTWEKLPNGVFETHKDYKVFQDNTADEFRAHHSLEHLNNDGFMRLMDELWDALKPNGILHIYVPNAEHIRAAHSDPTHRMTFTKWTWEYFTPPSLVAFPYTQKAWTIDEGYPRINGTPPDDLYEIEVIMRPVKQFPMLENNIASGGRH
jgi:SAM-dependent methyltransferase